MHSLDPATHRVDAMAKWNRTSRQVDGQEIIGSWRHAFINNGGSYYLTDLKVYADGLIDCWGLVTLEDFRDKLRSGWVATTFEEGAEASVFEVASWRFTDVRSWVSADEVYAEVVDEIDLLNGRPDSSDRCLQSLDTYLADPTETNRLRLAEAYEAVPEHRRKYLLGDMDAHDWPLRELITPIGEDLDGEVVTEERRAAALEYFAQRGPNYLPPADRTAPVPAAVIVPASMHHQGWPDPPGIVALHTQYPAPVRIGDVTYPTVEHAFWALRTTDPDIRQAVLAQTSPYGLSQLAAQAPVRAGWDDALESTITQLLRAKFQQHEALAEELLATGHRRIVFQAIGFGDIQTDDNRRHLIGRLLELVRAEQRARRSGLLDLATLA